MARLGRALAGPSRCRILVALLDGPGYLRGWSAGALRLIGVAFFGLAAYVTVDSGRRLLSHRQGVGVGHRAG